MNMQKNEYVNSRKFWFKFKFCSYEQYQFNSNIACQLIQHSTEI